MLVIFAVKEVRMFRRKLKHFEAENLQKIRTSRLIKIYTGSYNNKKSVLVSGINSFKDIRRK